MDKKRAFRDGSPAEERRLFDIIAGRFTPLQETGTGAIMTVHLARDERTGAHVAVKRLRTDMLRNANARYAMETEDRALSLVRHPGVPGLISSFLSGPDPYLVEEFKHGVAFGLESLKGPPRVLRAGISACGILSALHAAGIVHRDVKPSNLILDRGGLSVSLIDYGFSIVPGMQDFAMRVDTMVGTPMFMAPEQTYPRYSVDRRVDIYSLGVVIYTLLSGWYPYVVDASKDEKEEYVRAHRYEEAAPLHVRNPAIPPRLSYSIARALSKEPAKRYHDAEEMADALADSLDLIEGY